MKIELLLLIFILLLPSGCGGIPAQDCASSNIEVSGLIKNDDNLPISNAEINIISASLACPFDDPIKPIKARSLGDGSFSIIIKSLNETETVNIVINADGYQPYSEDVTKTEIISPMEVVLVKN